MNIVYSYLWIINVLLFAVIFIVVASKDYASFCYACISNYPTYSWVNLTEQIILLEQKSIRVPENASEKCNERLAIDELPEYRFVPGVFCPLGACVKLKWIVTHPNKKLKETFVVRHCWDKMWDRPYDKNKWFNCSNVEDMADLEAHMCSCHQDLCNRSWKIQFPSKISYILLIGFVTLLKKV